MKNKRPASKYVLTEIANFDARRGYTKCVLPGVGSSFANDSRRADADFWRNKNGNVAVRFSSQGYRFSFEACLRSGAHIPDDQLDDFGMFVSELLILWIVEGVDDTPDTEL